MAFATQANQGPVAKEELQQLKRTEIQALCKTNNLRAIGTTGSLIDSLVAHFDSLNVQERATEAPKQTAPTAIRPVPKVSTGPKTALQKPASKALTPSAAVPFPSARTTPSRGIAPRSRVSSVTTESPSSLFTDNDATIQTTPSSDDNSNLAPPVRRRTTTSTATSPAPRSVTKSQPDKPRISIPGTAPNGTVVRKLNTKASSSSLAAPSQTPRVTSPAASSIVGKKPTPTTIRRSLALSSIAQPTPTRNRTVSGAPVSVPGLSKLQIQIEELTAALQQSEISRKALEVQTASCIVSLAQLTERFDAREAELELQQKNSANLQEALESSEERISEMLKVVEDCRVDVASCVAQASTFTTTANELQKRVNLLDREVLRDDGKLPSLAREMGDVDVAMASDRDRVIMLEEKLDEVLAKVDEVCALGRTPPPSSSSRNKTKSLIGNVPPGKQRKHSIARAIDGDDEASPISGVNPFSRDRRLSRASISASLHHMGQASAPAGTVVFPSAAKLLKAPYTGNHAEFRFPRQGTTGSISTRTSVNGETRTSTPVVSRGHTRTNSFDQNKASVESPTAYAETDEDVTEQIRPRRTSSVKRSPPAIVVTRKQGFDNDRGNESSISDAPLSVSLSEFDVPSTAWESDSGKDPRSLLHQPQPSFGFITTDDEGPL